MIGIKLAHAHQHFRMDDPTYFGIYQVSSDLKKPVYLHTGSSPFPGTSSEAPYTDPTRSLSSDTWAITSPTS